MNAELANIVNGQWTCDTVEKTYNVKHAPEMLRVNTNCNSTHIPSFPTSGIASRLIH